MYKLAVVGNPIAHSRSPQIHTSFAAQHNIAISYHKIAAPITAFNTTIFNFRNGGGHGVNITAPFKEQAYKLSSVLTARAALAKSVNTLMFTADGAICGDNTDGVGLLTDIQTNNNFDLTHRRILVIGAGGAVRGILQPLLTAAPQEVILINRSVDKATALANEFAKYGNIRATSFADKNLGAVDVIIDCTPFTAWPLPLITDIFHGCTLVVDLKYHEQQTPIIAHARSRGVNLCLNGLGMLIEQAAASFFFWTQIIPETATMLAQWRTSAAIL